MNDKLRCMKNTRPIKESFDFWGLFRKWRIIIVYWGRKTNSRFSNASLVSYQASNPNPEIAFLEFSSASILVLSEKYYCFCRLLITGAPATEEQHSPITGLREMYCSLTTSLLALM